MLIGLTLTALVFGCKKNTQVDCESDAAKKWDANTSTCVDRAYYTFTLKGDAEGKWQDGVVAQVTVPGQHTTNTLEKVGDCVKVEDVFFTETSVPVVQVISVSTILVNQNDMVPGHYDITAEAGGGHGYAVTAGEMNTAKNCVRVNEDVQHVAEEAAADGTTPAAADGTTPAAAEVTTPAATDAVPAPAADTAAPVVPAPAGG